MRVDHAGERIPEVEFRKKHSLDIRKAWFRQIFHCICEHIMPGRYRVQKANNGQYICKQLQQRNHLVMQFSFDSKSAGNVALQCLVNFYQTILHQLLQAVSKNHPKSKAACFDVVRKRKLAEDTEQDSFKDAIKQILEIVGPTFLVIDALDECKEDDDPQLLQEWLAREDQHPGLKVLITSRPEQRILDVKDLSLFISLELNSLVDKSNNDIRLFIQARLRKSKDLPNIDNIHQSIERKLMTKANVCTLSASKQWRTPTNRSGHDPLYKLDAYNP